MELSEMNGLERVNHLRTMSTGDLMDRFKAVDTSKSTIEAEIRKWEDQLAALNQERKELGRILLKRMNLTDLIEQPAQVQVTAGGAARLAEAQPALNNRGKPYVRGPYKKMKTMSPKGSGDPKLVNYLRSVGGKAHAKDIFAHGLNDRNALAAAQVLYSAGKKGLVNKLGNGMWELAVHRGQ